MQLLVIILLILVAFVLLQNHVILGGYVHRLQNGGNELTPDQLETIINAMVDDESDDVEDQKKAIHDLNENFSEIKENMPRNQFLLVDYFMTEDEMKNAVTKKLRQLREDKKFLTKEEFKKQYNEEGSPVCTDFKKSQEGLGNSKFCWYGKANLQRVIAFEFLKRRFQELGVEKIFKVPEYYLVTPSLNDIKVVVSTPGIAGAGVEILSDCVLYTRLVDGDPYATRLTETETERKIIEEVKYVDLLADNIRKTKDGEIFILDTEAKSFRYPDLKDFQRDWNPYKRDFLYEYLMRRFYTLRNEKPKGAINFTVSLNN